MSTASSKRKTRDGSEDAAPSRKKAQRKADKTDQQPEFVDFGSGGEEKKPKSARKYKDKFAPRPEKEYPSINDLKKRIRDVKRLLNKQDLSADARILQERALEGYENDLKDETKRREKSQLISKYHFVRFLDRKAANKELARLTRRQKAEDLDPKEKAQLEAKISDCQVNINYTIYYPLTEKYLSIYPKSNGKPEAKEAEPSKRGPEAAQPKPALWPIVAKCMEEKTLDLLREGKLNINFKGEKIQDASDKTTTKDTNKEKSTKKEHQKDSKAASHKDKSAKREKHSGKNDKSARKADSKHVAPQPNADDEESDGGFFE
ncbi:unnamed protein product [Penicillium salamii]|uniref:rRNA-processing protein EFG1 n=1 Tax=Penicillium salamii TaxID=1612424 RepID=A0A9W4J2E2_9EURO|nr:unnamed protein product [Penicillium salamii]CAG8263892.1 unnamed protein product [Penicillium salamii]CAG8318376.1 unnamed protein product [Penicillium salamii]CAG8366981.1 unnamed protein product [Penicillium salamii]CAG8391093.1 unnamed protein product [Penicillium salamii]